MLSTVRARGTLALAAVLLALPRIASAQCFGPDGMNGACCAPVTPNLPQFPQTALPALGICWDNCAPVIQRDIRVDWAPLISPLCTEYTTTLNVVDSLTGIPLMSGNLVLDYTRTWGEINPAGVQVQVWRFVAKADLKSTLPAGVVPFCPLPACLPPVNLQPSAFFYGYVDYVRQCGTANVFQQVLVLHHQCDHFIHKPGLSSRPGAFHPNRSYSIVAPHSPAQPFVPVLNPAPGGPLVAEAWRNVSNPFPLCRAEDPVTSGILQPIAQGCFCPLAVVPPQHTVSVFNGKATCPDPLGNPSNWQSQNISFPVLPWVHLVSTSIGCWSNPGVYPGNECAWVEEGLFRDHDACETTAAAPADFFEVFYGGRTRGGWNIAPTPVGPPLTQNFLDLADNFTAGPPVPPIFGNIMPTDHLIYVNVP